MAQQETHLEFSLKDLEALAETIGHHVQSFAEWLEMLITHIRLFFRTLNRQAHSVDMPEWLFREIACGSF